MLAVGELGRYYQREARWTEAIGCFEEYVILAPDALDYRLWLGQAYIEVGKLYTAEAELLRVTRESPATDIAASAFANLGRAYMLGGDSLWATEAYQHALEIAPGNAGYHLALARAYRASGALEQALDELRWVLATEPNNKSLQAEVAQLEQELGR